MSPNRLIGLWEGPGPAEAVAWYHTAGDDAMYGLPYRAAAWLRRGRIAEAAGDAAAAEEAYGRYVRLWATAEREQIRRVTGTGKAPAGG